MAFSARTQIRRLSSALLFSMLALSASYAAAAAPPTSYPACERDPTESDVSAAKGAFEAGQVSFQEADYDRAILYWEDAFRRDCTAAPLLLNLSRAYELSGQKAAAILTLETFLERRPNHDDRPSIEKRIAVLKKSQAEAEKATPEPTPAPVKSEPAEKSEPVEQEEAPTASRPKWPIFVTGGGVAVGLLGLALWGDGQKKIDRCNVVSSGVRSCATDALAKEAGSGQSERNFGVAMTVVGAAAAVTGGVFWIYTWTRDEKPSETATRFVPVISPEFGGFSFSGTF